jgi:hypothetical protein
MLRHLQLLATPYAKCIPAKNNSASKSTNHPQNYYTHTHVIEIHSKIIINTPSTSQRFLFLHLFMTEILQCHIHIINSQHD